MSENGMENVANPSSRMVVNYELLLMPQLHITLIPVGIICTASLVKFLPKTPLSSPKNGARREKRGRKRHMPPTDSKCSFGRDMGKLL